MISAIAFFGTLWGRVALGVGIVVAMAGLRLWDVHRLETRGIRKEQVRVEQVGKKIDQRAQKKRERVQQAPSSDVDAALRKFCRDC